MAWEQLQFFGNMPISDDRALNHNRPDIIIKDHTTEHCTLIDITIPSDRNVSMKEFEKLNEHKDMEIEVS